MKRTLSSIVFAVCLAGSPLLGQEKIVRKSRKTAPPKIICSVDSVPKGMVVIGYKDNTSCTSGTELLMKRPSSLETVCANSPVPDGYSVQSITSSADCTGENPLTNAVVIAQSDTGPSSPVTSTDNESSERRTTRVSRESSNDEPPPKSPLEQRAVKINNEAKLENAATRGDIMAGMTRRQVIKAWGLPDDADSTTRRGSPTESEWVYRRNGESVRLYFKDGILTDWVWRH